MTPHFGRAARLTPVPSLVFAGFPPRRQPGRTRSQTQPPEPNLVVTEG